MITQQARRCRRSPFKPIAWIVGAIAASVALAACSGGSPSPDAATPDGSDFVNEGPPADKPLESVEWGTIATPESFDPALGTGYSDEITTNLCESLVRFAPDGSVEPALAESIENPDPLTFVYTIRDDVTFWDGSPLTATDVAYSLNRHLDQDFPSNFSTYYGNVRSIEVTGDRQVTVRMKQADYLFPNELATFAGAIVQKAYAESQGKEFGTKAGGVMCTGPYQLESWTPESVVLKASPTYWNPDAQPKVGTLSFRLIADEDTVTSGLLSGDLDGASLYGSTGATRLQSGTAGDLLYGTSTLSTQLIMTTREGPLQNRDVREALSLALPREGIAKVAYANTAAPSKSLVSAIQPWAYAPSVFRPYFDRREPLSTTGDLDKARKMVEAADLSSKTVTIAISSEFKEVSDLIVEAATSIGLDATTATLNATESLELYYDEELRGRYDAFILPWNTNVPDPLEMLVYFKPGGVYNYAGYDNPDFSALVDEALATADPEQRAELVTQALTILDADLPWIPIVDQPHLTYMSDRIGGGPVSTFGRYWSQWGAYLAGR